MRPLSSRRVDINVHLLAVKSPRLRIFEAVDYLQHSRIHSLSRVAGQRGLGHDIGIKADTLQSVGDLAVAAKVSDRRRTVADAPCIALVYLGSQVQVLPSAENHQRFCERTALRVLSETDLVLENG